MRMVASRVLRSPIAAFAIVDFQNPRKQPACWLLASRPPVRCMCVLPGVLAGLLLLAGAVIVVSSCAV